MRRGSHPTRGYRPSTPVLLLDPGAFMTTMVDASARRAALDVALGDAYADSCVRGGMLVNVEAAEIYQADVAIKAGRVAAVATSSTRLGRRTLSTDATNRYLVPGLVETHIHHLSQLSRRRRVRASVAFPWRHDRCRRLLRPGDRRGERGRAFSEGRALRNADPPHLSRAYDRVPAKPLRGFDAGPEYHAGRSVCHARLGRLSGLSETPFFAVTRQFPEILDLFDAALAQRKVVTGHAPGISTRALQAYIAMGAYTDHESEDHIDALTKARCGMKILSRQGSLGANVAELARMFTECGSTRGSRHFLPHVASPDKLAGPGGSRPVHTGRDPQRCSAHSRHPDGDDQWRRGLRSSTRHRLHLAGPVRRRSTRG